MVTSEVKKRYGFIFIYVKCKSKEKLIGKLETKYVQAISIFINNDKIEAIVSCIFYLTKLL